MWMRSAQWWFALDKQGDFSWKKEGPSCAKGLHHCGQLCDGRHAQRLAFRIQISLPISPLNCHFRPVTTETSLHAHFTLCHSSKDFKSATANSHQHLKSSNAPHWRGIPATQTFHSQLQLLTINNKKEKQKITENEPTKHLPSLIQLFLFCWQSPNLLFYLKFQLKSKFWQWRAQTDKNPDEGTKKRN